jgi:hypothetical protein
LQLLHTAKRTILALLSVLAVVALLLFVLGLLNRPPSEKMLVQNFQNHRASYERLRDMLLADDGLERVASWGVETTDSAVAKPPAGRFPVRRYDEYVALLKDVGAKGAFRDRGQNSDVGITVWASGWAGDTRHIAIYWMNHKPSNEVSSLDDFYRTPKPRGPVFRHIDGNWFLWADW